MREQIANPELRTPIRPALSLAALALFVPAICAQDLLHTFDGDSIDDRFGTSVAGAGDVDLDGYGDIIAGAPQNDLNGGESGSARVLSGYDGAVLYTFYGDSAGDQFGYSVSGAGDVNHDGYDDLVVGAPFDDDNGLESGSARVFSGVDGSVLYTFYGDAAGDRFGRSVAGAGDVNLDGDDDIIVGAWGDDDNGSDSGSARVLSGADGAILYTFFGDSAGDQFGWSVDGAGDVNNDGYADLVVGAWLDDDNGPDSGSARVFSGVNGATFHTIYGDSTGDGFGYSVSGAGDTQGDYWDDIIVGAQLDDVNGSNSGSARIFCGRYGVVLHSFFGDSTNDRFGFSVADAGDVNHDGLGDVIVGAWGDDDNGSNSGSARVFSGDGSLLYTVHGDSAGDRLGWSIAGAVDTNRDGDDDLIAGVPLDDNNGAESGSVRVLSLLPLPNRLFTFYGSAFSRSFGLSVAGAGDVDKDGYVDFIVGAHTMGHARVLSGSDGSILYKFWADSPTTDGFGRAVDGVGDVNNDGYDDVIVGAFYDDDFGQDSGSARVFSGVDGSILYTLYGDSEYDWFGYSVAGLGDVDGDGRGDFAVGAPMDKGSGSSSGSVWVFSGVDGSTIYSGFGPTNPEQFGLSVGDAGDVNKDGHPDVVVGANLDGAAGAQAGSVWVISPIDGTVLFKIDGDVPGIWLGFSVDGAGDVNNDGYPDIIAGAPHVNYHGTSSGIARVFSGVDGSVLYTFHGDSHADNLGVAVSGVGDVNNDGFDDVAAGAPFDDDNGTESGMARVYSGADGSVLYTFYGDSGSVMGRSLDGVGDVNKDGYDDFIVGMHLAKQQGVYVGAARVFSGLACCPITGQSCTVAPCEYCPSMLATTSGGPPRLGSGSFALELVDAPSTTTYAFMAIGLGTCLSPGSSYIFCDTIKVNQPLQFLAAMPFTAGVSSCTTDIRVPVPIPDDPIFLGTTLGVQWAVSCDGAFLGTSISNCLSIVVTDS